jgi:hypothetical protein
VQAKTSSASYAFSSEALRRDKNSNTINFVNFRHSCEVGLGDCTAKARRTRSKEFLIKKFSDLCELSASVVNTSSQKTRNN